MSGRGRRATVAGTCAAFVMAVLVYVTLAWRGEVTPPDVLPRENERLTTLTWSQTQRGGYGAFRTITVHRDGTYRERFARPVSGQSPSPTPRRGTVPAAELAKIRSLATSPQLAAEARKARHMEMAVECPTDVSGRSVAMGGLRIDSRCAGIGDELPTFAELSATVQALGADVTPPGGA